MKKILLSVMCVIAITSTFAQSFQKQIAAHRRVYKAEFLEDANSPLKKDDLESLDFFAADESYKVVASFTPITDTNGFDMQTHSGKIKRYVVYGKVNFTLHKKKHQLFLYKSKASFSDADYADYMFLPFNDATNYTSTYGGGRYLDFRFGDLKNNQLIIDFNKCYNPYCAYASGYSCPIPPKENNLKIKIEAGEKLFKKAMKE
jgi:uncharacterized protein